MKYGNNRITTEKGSLTTTSFTDTQKYVLINRILCSAVCTNSKGKSYSHTTYKKHQMKMVITILKNFVIHSVTQNRQRNSETVEEEEENINPEMEFENYK